MTTATTTTPAAALGLRRPEALDLFDIEQVPSEHRAAVEALIPSALLAPQQDGAGYVMREVDGMRCLDAFALATDSALNVLLKGPTGAAKTLSARAFAAAHRLPCYSVALNGGVDPSALWGRWLIDGDDDSRAMRWVWSPAALVVMYGGVLILDEINMAHPRITAALHDLLDDRRATAVSERWGEIIRAHPATLFVSTLNPGYQGTAALNEALARRFAWPIEWGYDAKVERALIPSASLIAFANQVRDLGEIRTDLSTAALCTFTDTARIAGVKFAAGRLLAGFRDSERGGVARALELRLPAIAQELGCEAQELDL